MIRLLKKKTQFLFFFSRYLVRCRDHFSTLDLDEKDRWDLIGKAWKKFLIIIISTIFLNLISSYAYTREVLHDHCCSRRHKIWELESCVTRIYVFINSL